MYQPNLALSDPCFYFDQAKPFYHFIKKKIGSFSPVYHMHVIDNKWTVLWNFSLPYFYAFVSYSVQIFNSTALILLLITILWRQTLCSPNKLYFSSLSYFYITSPIKCRKDHVDNSKWLNSSQDVSSVAVTVWVPSMTRVTSHPASVSVNLE